MAILYTDYLSGNDTTGNGTIATPYKTINKAMTVGTNGDEIRVAGSGFTALSGTVTATTNTGTTWNTSSNLTGVLLPGDIITVNDAEFGDQKFFYKVFSVGASSIVVDGAWNRTPNTTLTFSKITTQHYYTTTANTTFENVNIAGKTDFKITGGWTSSFTAQDGWTVMNYQGGTATANSGTGFTAFQGGPTGNCYVDRFMLSHLNTGFTGSTNRWYPGNLAFVFFGGTAPFGAAATSPHPTYGIPDLRLTNTTIPTALGAVYVASGDIQLKFNNLWYAMTSSPNTSSPLQMKFNNVYARSSFSTGVQGYGAVNGVGLIIDNLTIATQQNNGTTENICLFGSGTPSASSIDGSISIVGPNTTGYNIVINTGITTGLSFNQIKLSTNIEDQFGSGIETKLVSQSTLLSDMRPRAVVFDSEGEKQVYGNGNIAYADSTVFDTGTNSLRTSKVTMANSFPSGIPIFSFYNTNSSAKTITIRAKASANTNVSFGLFSSKLGTVAINGANNTLSTAPFLNIETEAITTSWADYTYTGVNATFAALLGMGYVQLYARTDNMTAKYLWIDSVTIS